MGVWEDFKAKYNQPKVDRIIVGFSGLDPSLKSLAEELTQEHIDNINKLVLDYLLTLKIKIDSGEIDPEEEVPVVPSTLQPIEISHEQLEDLFGGDEEGHYHLKLSELDKLREYPEYTDLNITSAHNDLTGLQGGADGEYYHLTQAERDKLANYSAYVEPKHEELPDLQGGATNEHYHLTEDEHTKLEAVIEALIPEGEDDVVIPSPQQNHEELSSLLGGKNNEHYHLTADEWTKIKKLLKALYPDSDDPLPDVPIVPFDPYAGLPKATPPQWEMVNFPTGFSAFDGVHKMYYGEIPVINAVSSLKYITGLVVFMLKGSNTAIKYMVRTTDLVNWHYGGTNLNLTATVPSGTSLNINDYGRNVGDWLYVDVATLDKRLFILGYPTADTINGKYIRYYQVNGSGGEIKAAGPTFNTISWLACCYSPDIHYNTTVGKGTYLFVSQSGVVARCQWSSATALIWLTSESIKINMTVNPGCAEWIPTAKRFCVAGPEGTAISEDGVIWTVHSEAPHNLRDMTWMTDFESPCLFAWREEDRKFYISANGYDWVEAGKLPSTEELSTINAVAYNSDYKELCVIGGTIEWITSDSSGTTTTVFEGTSRYAYFSAIADLNNWRQTSVRLDTNVPMGSVIWMPSTQKYVLMPTEGSYFYTFDRASWKDEE